MFENVFFDDRRCTLADLTWYHTCKMTFKMEIKEELKVKMEMVSLTSEYFQFMNYTLELEEN